MVVLGVFVVFCLSISKQGSMLFDDHSKIELNLDPDTPEGKYLIDAFAQLLVNTVYGMPDNFSPQE